MLTINSLVKTFSSKNKEGKLILKTAVDNLSLNIQSGEIFGLLGPNGAGKTTTIRMLTMLTRPTSGDILYNGKNIFDHEQEIKKYIGVVPQHINFDQDLTVWENMELHGRLHHMPTKQRRNRISELAAKHKCEDADYLDYLAEKNGVDLSDEAKTSEFVEKLKKEQPKYFAADIKPGAGPADPPKGQPEPKPEPGDRIGSIIEQLNNAPEIK